jgi:predicted nucleotidyltransferase component of viral defense system
MVRTSAQQIEAFHLAFLQVFVVGVRKERCILKGGANLRYFFNSVRYSNDIDLDVVAPRDWQLEEAVDGALASAALSRILQTADVGIVPDSISKPKRTPTTRRWRLGLTAPSERGGDALRTTIEFSAREDGSDDQEFAPVPPPVVRPYGLLAPTVTHYRLGAALEQKVAALAERSQTKARDVFDLDLLFRLRDREVEPRVLTAPKAELAAERGLALTDEDFESQVVPFLDPDVAAIYSDRWSEMRESVAERLLELVASAEGGEGVDGEAISNPLGVATRSPTDAPELGL